MYEQSQNTAMIPMLVNKDHRNRKDTGIVTYERCIITKKIHSTHRAICCNSERTGKRRNKKLYVFNSM